ncbi:MAG: glycosyltransferase family 2 protein [Gammaproteobacteria bacterium]|nr:glycosyltransferase family 2 protein [Gammaproteobacteria bacterium]MDH3372032.1 glycosyltransferase family 2 protein [Gammaproteobacteria bacterium]MDH3407829.1 glycosyltransferase family 2 protein [Gammaproteobacteria bacterium]MDH3552006.1 glycosyltransferase family 2 protein [Gammaproteobacteria bacterium]
MLTCVVVPHFDHVEQFASLLPKLCAQGLPIVVVDDASPDGAYNDLQRLLAEHAPGSILVRHADNLGKGGAVMTGLRTALDAGYTHALQIDADGQHDVTDIPRLRQAAEEHPERVICGQPVFDDSISKLRYYGRYLTLSLSWLESLSTEIRDGLCGFRLYPLQSIVALFEKNRPGQRMAFDPEILVRAVWAGMRLQFIPVHVRYPEGGRSHFLYFRDNVEISWMHIRLILGMLLRLPVLIWRRQTGREEPATR